MSLYCLWGGAYATYMYAHTRTHIHTVWRPEDSLQKSVLFHRVDSEKISNHRMKNS